MRKNRSLRTVWSSLVASIKETRWRASIWRGTSFLVDQIRPNYRRPGRPAKEACILRRLGHCLLTVSAPPGPNVKWRVLVSIQRHVKISEVNPIFQQCQCDGTRRVECYLDKRWSKEKTRFVIKSSHWNVRHSLEPWFPSRSINSISIALVPGSKAWTMQAFVQVSEHQWSVVLWRGPILANVPSSAGIWAHFFGRNGRPFISKGWMNNKILSDTQNVFLNTLNLGKPRCIFSR